MLVAYRLPWISAENLLLLGYSYFSSVEDARDFVEEFYQSDEQAYRYSSQRFGVEAYPRHGIGKFTFGGSDEPFEIKGFVLQTVSFSEDSSLGPRARGNHLTSHIGYPVFFTFVTDACEDATLWYESRSLKVDATHVIPFEKPEPLPQPAEIDNVRTLVRTVKGLTAPAKPTRAGDHNSPSPAPPRLTRE